jgi:hypothetical protein
MRREQLEHLVDQHRHDAFRRLVQQDHARPRHHRARDGQHLLLAAGQRRGLLRQPLLQAREGGGDLVDQFGPSARAAGDQPSCRFSRTVRPGTMRRSSGT